MFVTDAYAVLQDALIAAVQTVQTVQALTPLTILVPNNSVAVYLRHAIAWAGRGHFGLQFSTPLDFARDCAEDSLIQAGWQPLPPLAAPFIVQELLREAATSPLFTPPSQQSGFTPEFTPGLAILPPQRFSARGGAASGAQRGYSSAGAGVRQTRGSQAELPGAETDPGRPRAARKLRLARQRA